MQHMGARFVMEIATTPKRSILRVVIERVKSGLCLLCDREACTRGLCNKHYVRFRTMVLRTHPDNRLEFEGDEIREGRILHPQWVREVLRENAELQTGAKAS